MTTQEKIKHFKGALKYFSWQNEILGKIYWGSFCNYFKRERGLNYGDQCILESEWIKYRTNKSKESLYHFKNHKERRKALRQIIKDLKQQL